MDPTQNAQVDAMTAAAGICRREDRLMVRMTGDDRVSFLHGMCSNDIVRLRPGALTYALILTDHAHVVADLYVWAEEDALYLDIDRGLWPGTRAHLEKFLVADDVEMELQDDLLIIDVTGPKAGAAAAALVPASSGLAPWSLLRADRQLIANLPRIGLPAFTVVVPKIQAEGALTRLL